MPLVSTHPIPEPIDDTNDFDEPCVVCGQPIDYCQGHGEIGDPEGYAILQAWYGEG